MPTLAIPLAVLMEVVIAEVGFMNHFQLLRGDCPFSCTSLVPSKRSLSLHIYHKVLPRNIFRFTCSVKSRKSVRRLTALSTGKPSISADKLCKIIWTIKADLEDGQLLYITGDPAVLGCWKLDMAILMSPTEHANIWKAEFKIACGLNFKYTYFIKGKSGSSSDILWKPGPEFFLSVPPTVHGAAQILVRDSWIRSVSQIPAARACAHYIEDMYPLEHTPISLPVKDEEKNMNQLETDIIKLKALGSEDEFYYDSEDMVNAHNMVTNSSSIISANFQPIEEPWLLYPPSFIVSKDILESDEARIDATVESQVKLVDTDKLLHEESSDIIKLKALGLEDEFYYDSEDMVNALYMVSNSSSICSDNFQPIEEPWLLYPPSFIVSKDILESDEARIDGSVETQVKLVDTDKLLHEESSDIIQKDPVSTIILINSSICTMQRIAVLEDEKLVELLLEPVKNNVQCDSVYIGIVTKLVPHLGGAFVNIGSSRPSLMDIKHNREPFIFPPFRQRTKKEDLQASSIPNENNFDGMSGTHSEDGSLQSPDNDYDEQEGEDDFDISEVLKENVNGSLVDDGEVEADFEDEIDGNEVHIEEETNGTSLTTGINGSVSFKILQDKDTKGNKVPPEERKWTQVRKGTKIIVQVVKEGLGTKGPTLTAYPKLRSRFWILMTRCDRIGVSKKISGAERTRLKVIAKTLQPQGFGLTVRTVAAGHSLEELQKDLEGLLSTWKNIMEQAKSAALAADEGIEGAVPVIMHTAMGQTLSVVQDYFSETVKKMVVDSPRTYHEVTRYLREIAPDLCDRVELYDKSVPLFDEFNIEGEIDNILSKRVPLANGGSLVIEQTEALVSIDVNGGHGMLGHGTSQEKAILDVNLVAAKQIARELRLRDIGGIIVVDFIDMTDEANKRLVYEEAKKAVERDRSLVKVSELSRHGLMEITRKRVRPSVTFMVSEPCSCCHGTGRVEALETSFSKIEQQICRLLATMEEKPDPENPKSWPKFILRVDRHMCDYLTAGKKTRLAILSSSLKVWILLKVARGFTRGTFEVKSFTDENEKAEKNQYRRKVAMSMLRSSSEGSTKKPGQNVNLVPVKKLKSRRK